MYKRNIGKLTPKAIKFIKYNSITHSIGYGLLNNLCKSNVK